MARSKLGQVVLPLMPDLAFWNDEAAPLVHLRGGIGR
jgi:hypothetical protein